MIDSRPWDSFTKWRKSSLQALGRGIERQRTEKDREEDLKV